MTPLIEDPPRRTIVDVLDEALGGSLTAERASSLSAVAIEQLAASVTELYSSWNPPLIESGDLRIYSGGWIARNFVGDGRRYLLTSLLYSPEVVIHDPVAEWFDASRRHLQGLDGIPSALRNNSGQPAMVIAGDEVTLLKGAGYYVAADRVSATREYLASVVPALAELAPLIRAGVVLPIPELHVLHRLNSQLHSAVRSDVHDQELRVLIDALANSGSPPARSNFIRGAETTPSGGVARGHEARAIVQNPAYYFEKTMAIADWTGARYVAPSSGDAAVLEHRLRTLGRQLAAKTNANVDLRLVPALAQSDLPFLQDVDASLLLKIRRDESAFDDWRKELRATVRTIELLPSEGSAFEDEARDVFYDTLRPIAAEVKKAVSTSAAMRNATKDGVADLSISLASIGVATLAFGPAGAAVASATAAIALPMRWAYKVLFRPSPTGARAVIAQLVQRN